MNLLTITCLVSAILSLVFALMIFTLRRSARILQEKKWANPFAITFFVLAGMYALRFVGLLAEGRLSPESLGRLTWTISIITFSASGVTNYLFFLAAFRLSEPALRQKWVVVLRTLLLEHGGITLPVLCSAGLIQIIYRMESLSGWLRVLVLIPDNVFSALALLSMGLVLFRNIRFRRDKLMARLALVSSVGYALLYVFYGLKGISYLLATFSHGSIIDNDVAGNADLLTFIAALLLKVGLFFPAVSLLLLASSPLTGIERLLKSITRKDKEYLESDGIVKSICEELHLDRVELYVRLPGASENRIALFAFPRPRHGKIQDPEVFEHREGTDYDRVITSAEPDILHRDDYAYTFLRRISKVMVPLFFHNSVIACLKTQTREERFTEVDLSNLKRIATMISPAVQTYREMFALNKLSHDLSALQIEVVEYDPNKDIARMSERIHNVASPTIVGLSIEAGFSDHHVAYPHHESLEVLVSDLLHTELHEEDFSSTDGCYRWLHKELKMSPPEKMFDEQLFGRFILGLENAQPARYPPIGTSPICRRALTDLVTDTLLDFIRGYLNQLTDKLGEKLSGLRGTSVKEWHGAVTQTARLAKLPWVVVSYVDELRGEQRLGDESTVQLISRLECSEYQDEWQEKSAGFSLCRLTIHEAGVACVIRKKLSQSKATIWFGVAHAKFGPELDFTSPWTYFLDHFCKIADSSLQRHKDKQEHIDTLKPTYDVVVHRHELVDLAREILDVYTTLEEGVRTERIQCSDADKQMIESRRDAHHRLEQVLQISTDIAKDDERHGRSVDEVLRSVLKIVAGQLSIDQIKLDVHETPDGSAKTLIDVPFYVAKNAFSVLINNARDELRFRRNNGSERKITIVIDGNLDGGVMCKVMDTGRGLQPRVIPKIFRERCPSNKPNSVGVGLLSARRLLLAFEGDIRYEGRSVNGSGQEHTVFRVSFPRYSPENEPKE